VQEVHKTDKDQPVDSVQTMRNSWQPRSRSQSSRRSFLGLLAAMAGATGVFGVISYSVLSRTSEIGIHVVFGASGALLAARRAMRVDPMLTTLPIYCCEANPCCDQLPVSRAMPA
jgi:hypothetical protein